MRSSTEPMTFVSEYTDRSPSDPLSLVDLASNETRLTLLVTGIVATSQAGEAVFNVKSMPRMMTFCGELIITEAPSNFDKSMAGSAWNGFADGFGTQDNSPLPKTLSASLPTLYSLVAKLQFPPSLLKGKPKPSEPNIVFGGMVFR